MPDEWGGIEIEDEWGGVLVEDESDDRPPDRADFVEPPPRPRYSLDEQMPGGKPTVMVEGRTVESLPASLETELPVPSRVVAPFDIGEFSRTGTPENPYGVATVADREFLVQQPSEFDRPVIPPGVFKTALDIGSATLPSSEMLEGFKQGTAEQLAGMTSQASMAMTPAFAVPYVGPALALGMGAKALGAGAGTTVAGIESGDRREIGQGLSEVAGGVGMLYGGGVAARAPAPIPQRIVENIAKADAIGLTKSAQALADTVRREPITDRVQQLEPIEKGVPTAEQFVADVEAGKVNTTQAASDFGRTIKTAEEIVQLKEASRQMNEASNKAMAELPVDATLEQQQAAVDASIRPQFINEAVEAATGAYDVKLTDAKKYRELMDAGQPIKPATPLPEPAAQKKVGEEQPRAAASQAIPKPRAAAAEFNKLLEEYGEQLGWIQRPDAVAGIQRVKTGASTASIKADIAGRTELATARRKAIRDLGSDPTKTMPPSELAKLLPKLKEKIAKYESDQRALEQAAEVGVEGDLPAGSAPVDFLPGDATPKPGPTVPKLATGEKGTGDLLKTVEEPLKLVGEKGVDLERAASVKAAAEQAKTEAAASTARAQPELPGTELASAETKLANIVNQTIAAASPTRLGASPAATMRSSDVVMGAADLRSLYPAVEARWQAAVKGTETVLDKIKSGSESAWKSITREYADLPPREFPREIDVLRRLRASRNASARTTVDVLKGITNNLGPDQYGTFNRVVLLEDLIKDVEAGKYADGRDLPFDYKDAGQLTADFNKFKAISEATPQIKAALERRQEFMDTMRGTLVERGFLPEGILQDSRYFHHQVLLYMAEKNSPAGSRSFRDWFSGWQKKRTGSSLDYNRQYVESEAAVLSDAFNKITMQNLQGEMRSVSDLTTQLKELHGEQWREHIPKTHTLWQPKRGNAFYPVQTVAERVMDRYLSGLGDILPSEFKEALAVGARRQEWVVPKPLAKVLDNIAPRPDTWPERIAGAGIAGWKKYILLNPLRAAKYNLNNLSGDLDFLFAAQPKIFKEFKTSASDMWGFHVKGKSAVGDIKEAMQDGVIGSGWRSSELPDIARSDYFNWLTGEKPKLVDRYWDWIGKRNDAREDTGRLASYRFARKEWEAGRPFYGASVPADVNALATPRLKAAKVAREILIDYGRETEFGNFMRQKFVPFYRWMHGNFARYQQLIRNIPEQEGAGPRVAGATAKKAATLTVRMGAAYGIINLWNHLFFSEEEEELGEGRNQLHLILGRDDTGNIQTIRFQGALSDLLGWVGGENLPQDVEDLATGKATAGDKMEDAYEAAISRAVNASSPFAKTAAEIGLGRSFYPNALEPRPVRDKAEHAAGLFSLKPVYQWLAGKPHKPFRKELAGLIGYTTDPGEAAYNTTRHMAGEWLEENGEERSNVIPGKRSNALYYYKQALRYKDQEIAKKFLDEYNALGGKREGLNQSIKASAPLSMLGNKRKPFIDSLSPQEQEAVRRAEEWYRRVYQR